MSVDAIIETEGLTKRYGKVTAIDGLSIRVEKGAVYGFVGPNGAGKTTTMRILATLTRPTAGKAWVGGYSVTEEPRQVRRLIGYMPDFFGIYGDMTVREYLEFFAACYEIPESRRHGLIDDLLELVDLTHRQNDMVDKLSRGLKQRLCLARTLAHDPEVLILDEPASGLDPRARIEIRELLVELARMGKTIFFSSHILSDVEEICTHLGIIEAGKLVAQGDVASMRAIWKPERDITLVVLDGPDNAKAILSDLEGVSEVEEMPCPEGRHCLRVIFSGDDEAVSEMVRRLVEGGVRVIGVSEAERTLETVFMRATKGLVT